MSYKIWITGAVLGIVLANTGCVSCCSKSYAKALNNGAECDLPPECRRNVYVFMVHGITPTVECGLSSLREKLAESGFAKVGVCDIPTAVGIAFEVKRIARCDPDARFVLIGYDFGGAAAVCLARDLNSRGIPIEAVVLLDPLGCGEPCGAETLLITSGTTTSSAPHSSRLVVPDASHFKLPTHPATVGVITDLLKDIATRNYQPSEPLLPEWQYPYAPEMRPTPLEQGGEWDFLAETGRVPSPIGTRVESVQLGGGVPIGAPNATTNASARPSVYAGPVVIPK